MDGGVFRPAVAANKLVDQPLSGSALYRVRVNGWDPAGGKYWDIRVQIVHPIAAEPDPGDIVGMAQHIWEVEEHGHVDIIVRCDLDFITAPELIPPDRVFVGARPVRPPTPIPT
jgi:hypothetical protein